VVNHSDYWYSDLSGESQSPLGCDKYPEVGIARLAPSDAQDLAHQIAKIEAYMLRSDTGDWLNKTTLVAHWDDSGYLFDSVVRKVAQETMHFCKDTIVTIFGGAPGDSYNNESIRASVEAGTGVLIYLGHGDYNRWDTWNLSGDDWTTDNVGSLENPHTPVVFNLACDCGNIDSGTACLSQTWMSKYDSSGIGMGAVASFGAYASVDRDPDYVQCSLAVRATDDYYTVQGGGHEYVAPVFDLGGIQMLMDADIATKFETLGGWWSANIYSFYWLGNPAMPVWSGGVPESATVTHPSWITPGPHDSFQVSVKTKARNIPLGGARVCAYKPDPDGFYATGLTNDSGNVTLSFTASDTGSFFVSASEGHVNLSIPDVPHTPMLPHFDTAVVCKPDSVMTYPNWGRKLVRDPGTNTLHVAYTARDSVFYTQSTNAGSNWSTPEPIGAGVYPASALVPAGGPVPWVAYVTSDGSIVRAIRNDSSGAWDRDTIFPSSDSARAGAPSLAPNLSLLGIANAAVTYPVYIGSPASNYVFFNAFTPTTASLPETVDAAGTTSCYGASMAVTPGNAAHVAWARGESIFYRQRSYNGVWSLPVPISSPVPPITEPASNPSVEAYGDSVFCVWRGPHDSTNLTGDIWRRGRDVNNYPWVWADALNQSQSESLESDYPVMTTNFATVWQERVSQDSTEIWGSFLLAGPQPFFQTSLPSRYPQVDGYWIPRTAWFRCRMVWTQQASWNPPQDTLGFGWHDYVPSLGKGLGPSPRDGYEPASYYAAELGQPKQSPYCVTRGGFAQFESWNTDTSATGLAYQLPYLDPCRVYKLRAVLYHEGDSAWSAGLRCDSGPWHRVKVEPNTPDTVWLQVPKALYKNDARVIVEMARMTGGYVSLAKLKLFQIEEEPGDDGGVQSWGTGMTFVTRLRGCVPNPFAKGTSVNYELAQYGTVELTVHDVSGRLVRRLESGPHQRGFHKVRWNGTDSRGRVAPAGVYFMRFAAGGKVSTGRLTLVR
jgi:hypothetical protein